MDVRVPCWLLFCSPGSLTYVQYVCFVEHVLVKARCPWVNFRTHPDCVYRLGRTEVWYPRERKGAIELIIRSMFQTKANKKLVGFLQSLVSQSDVLFPDFVRCWSQDNSILCLFASTELQLPSARNNDYWRGGMCSWPRVLCLCIFLNADEQFIANAVLTPKLLILLSKHFLRAFRYTRRAAAGRAISQGFVGRGTQSV